jgi:hypothetical protein
MTLKTQVMVVNSGYGCGQTQTCGGVKPVNGIPTYPLDNWPGIYINKRLQTCTDPLPLKTTTYYHHKK